MKCGNCSAVIVSPHKNTKFCSVKCRTNNWNQHNKKRLAKYARDYRAKTKHYLKGSRIDSENIIYDGYKEPLRPVEGGFGYYGVVAREKESGKVQCHVCGRFFNHINNSHLRMHGYTSVEYKDHYGISPSTPLCSYESSEKHLKVYESIDRPTKDRMQANFKKSSFYRRRKKHPKMSLEVRNRRGTCPDQLLDSVVHYKEALGRLPTAEEFKQHDGGKFSAILDTFSTWTNAVHMMGLKTHRERKKSRYSKDKLLEYLRIFYQRHNRTPRTMDFKRSELPDFNVYSNAFGTINSARMKAGIPLLIKVGRWEYAETMDYKNNIYDNKNIK